MVEAPDHLEVLEAGEVLVDGGVLACETDPLAHALRLGDDVEPEHARRAAVGMEQRRQDPDGGGLAGAVRPEQPEDGARIDGQIDVAQRMDVAVVLAQAVRLDGGWRRPPR